MNGLGKTIAGTGGLRKIRCGGEGQGKRGGWRVVFADYPNYGVVILIVAFRKNVQENLTAEQVRDLRQIKEIMDREIERKYGKEE